LVHTLLGSNSWTAALFYFSAIFVAGLLLATLFAVLYHRHIYVHVRRPRYDASYRPRCSVIVPCKGVVKGLEGNLESFLKFNYTDYEVIFAVESETDPTVEIIRRIIQRHPQTASLVVAGLAQHCAQKNFNHLAAVRHAKHPDVYVFADADIGPGPDWLAELVLPLSDPKVCVTTGFRWQVAAHGKMAEHIHAFQSNVLYILFCTVAGVSKLSLLWGGSMAIRRTDFDALGVASRWSKTAVDDFTLSQLVMKAHRQAVLVPLCVTVTDDALQSFRQGLRWFERQTMFLKAYHRKTWTFVAMPVVAGLLFALLWPVPAFIVNRFSSHSFFSIGGGGGLVFTAGVFLHVLFYPFIESNPRFLGFVAYVPFSLFSVLVGALRTIFTNTITWGDVRYKLTFRGTVASVQRPAG
jgi:cellulose synthase/poly-beta-1,6-N-acetylglucosamine synthase-like glycosyltransferase